MDFTTKSEQDTLTLGHKVARNLSPGTIICIHGTLGAGKSVLIRGMMHELGVKEGIPSPTFSIVNEYRTHIPLYHFDLYRINDPFELYEIGFEEYIYGEGISFIEWPEQADDLIPEDALHISISFNEKEGDTVRQISVPDVLLDSPHTPHPRQVSGNKEGSAP